MARDERRYSRVYHEAVDDPKFRAVWDDDACLALWVRLLVAADSAWPNSATLPRSTKRRALSVLVGCRLVDLTNGDHYRIHGLDRERGMRSHYARTAAVSRWHPEGTADGNADRIADSTADGNAEVMLVRERERERVADTTPPPSEKGRRENGTNPRAQGTNPRATGDSPRQRLAAEKRDPTVLRDILKGQS